MSMVHCDYVNCILPLHDATMNKSSHRRLVKIPKKFHNILRKTPVLETLFNKIAGLQACNFIKKRLQYKCFCMNIAKFLRRPILKSICERLFLYE